jgi:uncharacterized protein
MDKMKKALILQGGWEGHTPKEAAALIERELRAKDFEVRVEASLDVLSDAAYLKTLDLIVPIWTMGTLGKEQSKNLCSAIKDGVGLGGFHGGMGDAFRGDIDYEWMVGGHFVGHPYVGDYTVELTKVKSPITKGMAESFPYKSEQYYMMLDPGLDILATTVYEHEGRKTVMPVVWTKSWGKGRVFYSALGHTAAELEGHPEVLAMTIRGMRWAAKD